mmetsp:Transcript_22404/g.52935  ORF Transcript_22404/g.52935 Transcript_22404/m.52935 type:complete len:588 (-) Transcript_22404:45-1808(-)|eukprot:CAMPEP_0177700678 /NCGR_PEP_ID=MMETSP0484_2-20121128/6219_1 /TAXON_ID=354590 /ORGANISM="Rhodomonas lens, Strain RHODO" /LENGTH=587 /DNA_ID=CAMNT_0019211887 /DNA_START=328 /DNA_END=2091 /DNA_ORIENTATION=-
MFYSTNILQKKGPLGTIWIAAHHDVAKKLTKLQILNTDIVESAGQIENPEQEMALRLSSHLLVGLSKIYTRKVQFLFTDCNEALSKITLAFRPSNVDMAPTSTKAQIRAITLDDPAISGMDLDLELNLTDADWLGNDVGASQVSAADITLPDIVVHDTEEGDRWEEEDPLFFGGAIESGANPLDVNYDVASPEPEERAEEEDPELARDEEGEVEEPEIRRDSDGSALNQPDIDLEMDPDLAGPDLPDFDDIQYVEPEPPKARPSEAVSGSVPPTPLKEGESMAEGMEFDTPVVEVKRPRLANRRKRNHAQLDKSTEIPKEVVRAWIMNPDSVSDLIRQPQPLPRNRAEVAKNELVRSKVLDAVMVQPLSGFLGPRLHRFMLDMSTPERRPAPASGKKRKAGQEEPVDVELEDEDKRMEDEDEEGDKEDKEGDKEISAAPEDEPEVPQEEELPMQEEEAPAEVGEASEAPQAGVVEGVFSDYVQDDVDELEEGDADKEIPEQQERTKKVILMLQKSFKHKEKSAPLRFQQMIHPAEGAPPPTKHTAAVAFFELLGLNAKGFVKLEQKSAYGDITIAPRDLLIKYAAKI